MINYRKMTVADIPAGLTLCRHAGWNQLESDWQLFLSESPEGCVVAVDENNNVIGTAATVNYENRFAWIGMVLVDPLKKRQGIGTNLLAETLQILHNLPCIKLDATPAGREVYLKLNFIDEYGLSRMVNLAADSSMLVTNGAKKTEPADMDEIIKLDKEVFGASRGDVLRWMWRAAPSLAFVIKKNQRITGYSFGRYGYNFVHFGPIVATNINDAMSLLGELLNTCNGKQVLIDAMHFDDQWLNNLQQLGFHEQRPFTRMYKGINLHKGQPEKQYAILGPEFG